MYNSFFKGFLVPLALLFLVGCHHNAHIRTQKPLSPSETAISFGITPFPFILGDYSHSNPLGIIGMRSEVSFLRGLKNDQELGVYAGLGSGDDANGFVSGVHYKKYKYLPIIKRLVKIGGGLEQNSTRFGKVLNSKISIISTSSKNNPAYGGIHLLRALSLGQLQRNAYGQYSRYSIHSIGFGVTFGSERYSKKHTLQAQIDISGFYDSQLARDLWSNESYVYDSMYLLSSSSLIYNFFLPPSNTKETLGPMPPVQKRKTRLSPDAVPNTSTKLFNPETGEPIKKESTIFDPETGEAIEKDPVEYDPETGEVID